MGSDSSPAPEIGGADLPPSSPEARGLSSSAGSSTSDAAASGSAPRPSSRTTRNLLGGDLSVLHGDAVRDSSHERTSLTLLGPRLDSPRDSTAEGGVVPVLGSRAQITYPTPTLPLLPQRYQEALNAEGSSSAETPVAGSSPLEGGELFFPGGGTSFRFRRASTPPQSVSSAAYTVGGRRDDAEEGSEPFRRRPRFRDNPSGPHVVGDELFFPIGPSFRDATSTPAQSTSSTSTAAYFLGSQRRVQGGSGTNPGRLRRRFNESPPTTPHVAGGEISGRNSRTLLPGGSSVVWTAGLEGGLTASDVRALELLVGQLHRELGTGGAAAGFWRFCFQYALAEIPSWRLAVQHDDQLVASWRVDLDAGRSDGRSDAAVASSGSPEVPVSPPPPSAGSRATTALGAAHGQVSSVSVQLIASRAHQKSAQEDFSYLIVWDDFWFALVSVHWLCRRGCGGRGGTCRAGTATAAVSGPWLGSCLAAGSFSVRPAPGAPPPPDARVRTR